MRESIERTARHQGGGPSIRFTLRTLFVGTALICGLLAWVVYQLNWIRQRHDFIAGEQRSHERRGVAVVITYKYPGKQPVRAPSSLWVFGEQGVADVCVLADEIDTVRATDNDMRRVRRARRLFPDAEVMLAHEFRRPSGSVFQGSFPPD